MSLMTTIRAIRRVIYHTSWGQPLIRAQTAWHNRLILGAAARPFPLLSHYVAPPLPEVLLQDYHTYTTSFSDVRWTIALELAQVLWFLLHAIQPRVVMDWGSGYSSALLRRYQAQAGCRVLSVDDSAQWLAMTRTFLEAVRLPVDDLMLWEDFRRQPLQADLILNDIGATAGRVEAFSVALDCCTSGGVVLVDDMHKAVWCAGVLAEIRRRTRACHDLSTIALDANLRYGWLVHNATLRFLNVMSIMNLR